MFSSQNSQVSNDVNYIEDVFSTWLYTGNGSTQTITNGIDLSTKGGLTWIKARDLTYAHRLFDTARGATKYLETNTTNDQGTAASSLTGFTASGFSLGSTTQVNGSGATFASWTFRKQKKFFDCGTYSGNGASSQTIAHALGAAPGCIVVKNITTGATNWFVYHKYMFDSAGTYGAQGYINLNTTGNSNYVGSDLWTPTTTTFQANGSSLSLNNSGDSYVYYMFAHNAGGFGLTGTDNVISCGSYTGTATVNLGYEPQWVLIKRSSGSGNPWNMIDNMRGWPAGGETANLQANTSAAESTGGATVALTATGFTVLSTDSDYGAPGSTYIYIAIRRGPMKVPTSGTSVFSPNASSAATNTAITTNFPIDLQIQQYRSGSGANWYDRLRGISTTTTASGQELGSAYTGGESSTTGTRLWGNTGFTLSSYTSNAPFIYWNFRRAPSFFDEVCYTGNGSQYQGIDHNLGVKPQIVLTKSRNGSSSAQDDAWQLIYFDEATNYYSLYRLNATNGTINTATGVGLFNATKFFAQKGDLGSALSNARSNESGINYVAHLFATCAGVSKVFSYTGNGSSQTINCGFTGGARFILIKRTDSTGDWYVWDTARGIVSANDPHLSLNTTAAEVTTDDTIDPDSTGFIVNQVTATNVNVSSATYIGIAIA